MFCGDVEEVESNKKVGILIFFAAGLCCFQDDCDIMLEDAVNTIMRF